jgi:hypothetical protein
MDSPKTYKTARKAKLNGNKTLESEGRKEEDGHTIAHKTPAKPYSVL